MSDLNPSQRAAVRHVDGPLLVVAGAGSGKTRVITDKIAHLVRRCGLPADAIAAVTFTNKAAREMQQRVARRLGRKESAGLQVSTFHTLGLRILRRELGPAGLRPGFSIFDTEDGLNLVVEASRGQGVDAREDAQRLLERISRWKAAWVTPEAAAAAAADEDERRASTVYAAYERSLRACNAVDFDDLIGLPVRLFEQHPERLHAWQERIRYLLIDEYQDTNEAQYRLVKLLAGERARFTAVGDDDQSIYAWRGAQPQNLAALGRDFPGLTVIKLEQNYRSTGNVLKAANALIANNPHVYEKRLWSALGPGDPLRVLTARDEEDEAERVVADLLHHKLTRGGQYGDYAILYRGNHQSRPFERALRERGIPYHLSGGTSFFAHAEVRDALAYFRLVVNPADDNAFLRIVNTPRRELGTASIEKLALYARSRDLPLLAAAALPGIGCHVGDRAGRRLGLFADWIAECAVKAERDGALAAAKAVIEGSEYREWLRETSSDERAAERRLATLDELLGWMARIAQGEPDGMTLAAVVNRLMLIDMLDRERQDEDDGQVRLMTLHAAKGLEFAHVYLVGMEENLLPHRSSIEADDIEEERRLAYVGITRARRSVTFSWAACRRRHGETVDCEPSRFLKELPQEDLVWEGGTVDRPRSRATGRSTLESLKRMLAER